jgi:hypothetical protein
MAGKKDLESGDDLRELIQHLDEMRTGTANADGRHPSNLRTTSGSDLLKGFRTAGSPACLET